MNRSTIVLLAALALSPSAFAAPVAGPADVTAALRTAGYADVRELEFEDGLWEAEVRGADGLWHEVAVDAATGEVFDALSPRPQIDADAVLTAIDRAGFRHVHDLDREGALWDAEAVDAAGARVELRVSGYDGRIVSARPDAED
jgi:hypothetical protein